MTSVDGHGAVLGKVVHHLRNAGLGRLQGRLLDQAKRAPGSARPRHESAILQHRQAAEYLFPGFREALPGVDETNFVDRSLAPLERKTDAVQTLCFTERQVL